MGILNPTMKYELNYQGKGCGGSCLPFDTIADAVAYATDRGANQYQVWGMEECAIVQSGFRKDGRFKWEVR